jgi:hypothetical protein
MKKKDLKLALRAVEEVHEQMFGRGCDGLEAWNHISWGSFHYDTESDDGQKHFDKDYKRLIALHKVLEKEISKKGKESWIKRIWN